MMLFVFALRGNFPHASNRLHKAQDRNLVVADANDQTTILIAMGARKRNGAFAVDQPRDVGSFRGIEPRHLAMQGHASGSARRRKKKRPPLGWPSNGGGGGTAVPSLSGRAGLCLHPVTRMRGVLSACADPSARSAVARTARL